MGNKSKGRQGPTNRLMEKAQAVGYETAYEFAIACQNAGIASYGLAFEKWQTGQAGNTQINNLLAIARFLGASKIEDVFEM